MDFAGTATVAAAVAAVADLGTEEAAECSKPHNQHVCLDSLACKPCTSKSSVRAEHPCGKQQPHAQNIRHT